MITTHDGTQQRYFKEFPDFYTGMNEIMKKYKVISLSSLYHCRFTDHFAWWQATQSSLQFKFAESRGQHATFQYNAVNIMFYSL